MKSLSVLAIAAGLLTHASAGSSQEVALLSGSHSNATRPFWENYTYCQGRIISEAKTWEPMENAQLIKLQIMHRHGARSPASGKVPGDGTEWYQCSSPDEVMFVNSIDPDRPGDRSPLMKEESVIDGAFSDVLWKGDCDAGQLTSLGAHRMQHLGTVLRSVYVDRVGFLPKVMSSAFKISHTYIWRTRTSVENLMAGLYPPSYREPAQTLTMQVKPSLIETMIPNLTSCPKLAALMAAYMLSLEYAAVLAPYASLQDKLVSAYNTSTIKGFNTTQTLWDAAAATYCHDLGLKGNLTGEDIQTLNIPALASYHSFFRSNTNSNATEALTLAAGPWLQEILASFEDCDTKLQVYSAHDGSLDMFLAIVADPDLPWPAYSASVEIELWRQERRGLVVRMFYEGMILPAHPDLKCSFDEGCPLETLKTFMEGYISKGSAVSACKV